MSAFFGARAPELVPEVVNDLNIKPAHDRKQPLHERSLSDLNVAKPTIRLVNSDTNSPDVYKKSPFPKASAQVLKPTSPTKQKQRERIAIFNPDSRPASRDGPAVLVPKPLHLKKPNRTSGSTTISNAETLVADSLFSPTSQRFSVESTLKGIPAPYTLENTPGPLEPLEEKDSSPARSEARGPEDYQVRGHGESQARAQGMVPSSSKYSLPDFELKTPTRPKALHRRSSSSGLGFEATRAPSSELFLPSDSVNNSNESLENSNGSGSAQDRAEPHRIIRYMSSSESIQPQYASVRPAANPSHSETSVWDSDSSDNVPPLATSRSRQHMHSASLNSYPSMSRLERSHLSTIASESEFPSSSRFSQASSAIAEQNWPRKRRTTIASSTYSESLASPDSSPNLDRIMNTSLDNSSSYSSLGERLRNDSVVPEPLFSSSAPIPQRPFRESSPHGHTSEMDDTIGELQALPLREKRSGYFVRQRSQTDLRPSSRRSNNTTEEANRWSTGSFIFPQWARSFYAGRSGLASANQSRVTLAGPPYLSANHSRATIGGTPYESANVSQVSLSRPSTRRLHSRNQTMDTLASRPLSTHSNWETIYTASPASLIPSIFRPRNRNRAQTVTTEEGIRADESTDSLGITILPRDTGTASTVPQTPMKQPRKKISFRHPLRSHPPKQTIRNITDPNILSHGPPVPLSTDPSYISLPHLVQNRRLTRHLSIWRVPSIDEPFPREILGKGNRQMLAFCLGFLFPPLWIVAAFLALPVRGKGFPCPSPVVGVPRNDSVFGGPAESRNKLREGLAPGEKIGGAEAFISEEWSWEDERTWLKARWWRNLNRVMSVVGVGIMAAIIALAVMAAKMP